MNYFYLLLPLSISSAFANERSYQSEMHNFKANFAPIIERTQKGFKIAETMKPFFQDTRLKTVVLTDDDCLILEKNIKINYEMDPFHVETAESKNWFPLCSEGKFSNKLIKFRGISNLGKPYTWILERYFPSENRYSYLFIDKGLHIVEVQWLDTRYYMTTDTIKKKRAQYSYTILAQDSENNAYFYNYFENEDSISTFQKFLPSDGSSADPNWKEVIHDKHNDQNDRIEYHYSKTDKLNWDRYFLPLTHAWSTGFYQINDEIHTDNNFFSVLIIKSKNNGKNTCTWGWQEHDSKIVTYPASEDDKTDCALNFYKKT